MELKAVIPHLREMLLGTIAETVQKLGPLPNQTGGYVRTVLASENPVEYMALGCFLEDSIKQGNYTPLLDGMEQAHAYRRREEAFSRTT